MSTILGLPITRVVALLHWGINFRPRFGSPADQQALNRVPFFNHQYNEATTHYKTSFYNCMLLVKKRF
jgi:hypothetical protein